MACDDVVFGSHANMGATIMNFVNNSTSTGIVINYLTTNVSGDLFSTLLLLLVLLIAVALTFRIPLEWTMPLVLPVLIAYMSYSSEFLTVGGVVLIYLAVVFTKMFVIND